MPDGRLVELPEEGVQILLQHGEITGYLVDADVWRLLQSKGISKGTTGPPEREPDHD
jgi:hypothetical protein